MTDLRGGGGGGGGGHRNHWSVKLLVELGVKVERTVTDLRRDTVMTGQ